MVDPGDLQQIERFLDVVRRALLSGVSDGHQAGIARPGEYPFELARRMAHFRGIQPHPGDAVAVRHGLVQGAKGVILVEMPQETHDQPRGNAELPLALPKRLPDAVQHRLEGHAAPGVALGVEENLGMHHPVAVDPAQIRHRQVVEIPLFQQHAHALVVDIQKGLQILELVRRTHRLDRIEGNPSTVAAGDLEHEVRLEAAFDVDVQFRLRQSADEIIGGVHDCIAAVWPLTSRRPRLGCRINSGRSGSRCRQ